MVGGVMALLIRAELGRPGIQFLSQEQYNQLFTMHGTIMLLLYATPILFGFANLVTPLQIGSPDVAFPRLNAFSYWLFLFGGLIVLSALITPGGAADFVVAHFHYVLFGTIVFATFAGMYFWFPKFTGRMLDDALGKWHFWTTFVGFLMTFLVQPGWATRACRAATPTTSKATGSPR